MRLPFTGTVNDGEFQIADVESDPPRVDYQNNFASMDDVNPDTGKVDPNRRKGSRDYHAYRLPEHFTSQLPLIYMLIALSRDAYPRQGLRPEPAAMQSMVTVAGAENIATEALYVFIGEVQHNWDLMRRRLDTAPRRGTSSTARPTSCNGPSITSRTTRRSSPALRRCRPRHREGDLRFMLRAIQEDALNVALVHLKVELNKQKTHRLADDDGILLSGIPILYGFNRLMDN